MSNFFRGYDAWKTATPPEYERDDDERERFVPIALDPLVLRPSNEDFLRSIFGTSPERFLEAIPALSDEAVHELAETIAECVRRGPIVEPRVP